ncbi:hypothetical protein BSF38_04893 [Paludisphaera borealis]|uniref:Uncharacterized protein n=1 Tax=Paludisphaera borealis TaxID=1387353 RepID=A0A1U7CWR2_9BACT|nr:hypothetical protein BSF38_04893 [Paludisphaera borealis]
MGPRFRPIEANPPACESVAYGSLIDYGQKLSDDWRHPFHEVDSVKHGPNEPNGDGRRFQRFSSKRTQRRPGCF